MVEIISLFEVVEARVLVNEILANTSGKKVCVDPNGQNWIQYPWNVRSDVVRRLKTQCKNPLLDELREDAIVAWVNEYVENAYIEPHKDRGGLLQVIVLLSGTDEDQTGRLFVEGSPVSLREGEAVLFRASEMVHWTLPYERPTKPRITGVLRFN